MAKPPRKIDNPHATMIHMFLIITLSRFSFASTCALEREPGATSFGVIVAYFALNLGRMLTSIIYILRKRTTAVIKANAF